MAQTTPYVLVLGTAQDGGRPHIGDRDPQAFERPADLRSAASLAIIDPASQKRWLVEATPDIKRQLHHLERVAGFRADRRRIVDGIAITHGHTGHYLGLAWLGNEMLATRDIPLLVMPRMRRLVEENLPWRDLVDRRNITPVTLAADRPYQLDEYLTIEPIPVPHRDEHSETVAFRIVGPEHSLLFLPDIDSWEDLDATGRSIEDFIASVDVALLDGTFLDGEELGGRNMAAIPHPTIRYTLDRLAALPQAEQEKVRFIHLNHTNRAESLDLPVVREGEIYPL